MDIYCNDLLTNSCFNSNRIPDWLKMGKIKRRVICVFGEWGKDTDFVLEPTCSDTCNCEECKKAFWVENEK